MIKITGLYFGATPITPRTRTSNGRLEMAIDTVVQRSAGLDIAKASLVACVRIPGPDGGWRVIKRKFTTMTAELLALQDWLAGHNIARVGMESTSDYVRRE